MRRDHQAYDTDPVSRERQPEMSPRERQILARIAAGKRSKDIAAELGISLRTVNTHRENIAKKLGTSSPAGFVRYAIEHGITETD
jgi:two-component system NarL family response regulator